MESRLDEIIEHLIENRSRKGARGFTVADVEAICTSVEGIFESEPSLLEIPPPVKICGDIHGQMADLLRVFKIGGSPPQSKYLFLGDYVDRGNKSVEVIVLLFALKVRYPDSIYLIRGNHESMEMTEMFGFMDECRKKLSMQTWLLFLRVFDYLPIGAVVGSSFFCIHGGLSPHLKTLDDIRVIARPTPIPEAGLMADLLWSDPSVTTNGFGPNERGSTITWGENAASEFLKANNLQYVVRGHQMAQDGFHFPFDPCRHTVTIFTASNYANECTNKAAFMDIDEDETVVFNILPQKQARESGKSKTAELSTNDVLSRLKRPGTGRQFGRRTNPMQQMRKQMRS